MTLTADELAGMRTDIETLLPDTVILQTMSSVSDGMGGQTVTWVASGTADCRLDKFTSRRRGEALGGGAIRAYGEWVLTVPYGTSINVSQRAVHGGLTYNITEVNVDKSWPDCVRATVELVS